MGGPAESGCRPADDRRSGPSLNQPESIRPRPRERIGTEGNGHDVRDDPAVFGENERFGGEVCDPELRRGRHGSVFLPLFERGALGHRMQGQAATTVATTSVILNVHDHDRGTRVSTRKGQCNSISTRAGIGESEPRYLRAARLVTPRLGPPSSGVLG